MMHDRRPLVTFRCDEALLRDLAAGALRSHRNLAQEIEARLLALRVIQEALRVVKSAEDLGEPEEILPISKA